jgi:hypothetical protein
MYRKFPSKGSHFQVVAFGNVADPGCLRAWFGELAVGGDDELVAREVG